MSSLRTRSVRSPRSSQPRSVLFDYVHGFVAAENSWRSWVRDPAGETGLRRQAQQHLERNADNLPTLAAHAQLDLADFDEGFSLGLQIILDGVEAQLPTSDRHQT